METNMIHVVLIKGDIKEEFECTEFKGIGNSGYKLTLVDGTEKTIKNNEYKYIQLY